MSLCNLALEYDHYTDYHYPHYPEIDKWGEKMEKDENHFVAGWWIPKYPHNVVFRESVFKNEIWGKTGLIPNDPELNKKYE